MAEIQYRFAAPSEFEVRKFQERTFGQGTEQANPERNHWLYDHLAIAQTVEGRVVGQNASIPVFLRSDDDQEVSMRWGIDLMVDPEFQRQGIAQKLSEMSRDGYQISGSLGNSEAGYRHALRTGYRYVTTVPTYVWFDMSPVRWLVKSRALSLIRVSRFTPEVGALWTVTAPHYPRVVVRDYPALAHRFDLAPYAKAYSYSRFYFFNGNDLVGYLVAKEILWRGKDALQIVDYFAAPRDVPAMFSTFAKYNPWGHRNILCLTLNRQVNFTSCGFLPVSRRMSRFMTTESSEDSTAADWFLTAADSDAE